MPSSSDHPNATTVLNDHQSAKSGAATGSAASSTSTTEPPPEKRDTNNGALHAATYIHSRTNTEVAELTYPWPFKSRVNHAAASLGANVFW